MSNIEIAVWSFPVMLVMIFLRLPIGVVMAACGIGGSYLVYGSWGPIMTQFKSLTYGTFSNYNMSVVPLFLLMGQFATMGGLSRSLFKAFEAWLGHLRGGVGIASVGACAGFGAICGSSLATAATMGRVALPEMRQAGYSGGLATATLAAGGTLGILIPPSVVLVVYALLTEQNIAKLFLAAFVPGILAAIGYTIVINMYVRLKPDSVNRDASPEATTLSEKLKITLKTWPVIVIFLVIVIGIYGGWFTPTAGAAVGAFGTGIAAWVSGGLNRQSLKLIIMGAAIPTGMIFMIVLGAGLFNTFLALSQLPQELAQWVQNQHLNPWAVLSLVLVLYLILGCVMDSLSMILLTIPIFFPMIIGLDFGLSPEETAIWFGILVLIVVELGLITPPMGMNLFVINGLAGSVPLRETYTAIIPFVAADIIRTAILVIFPSITLFAVRLL